MRAADRAARATAWSRVRRSRASRRMRMPGAPGPGGRPQHRRAWYRHPWRIAGLVFVLVGLVVIVGGYLWVELGGRTPGPPGATGHRHRAPGAGRDQPVGLDTGVQGGDRQRAGLPDLEPAPQRPERPVRLLRLQPEQQLRRRSTQWSAPAPTCSRWTIPPGFTVREVAERVGQLPGHSQAAFAAAGHRRHACTRPGSRWASPTSTGCSGPGPTWWSRARPTPQLLTDMVDRFDTLADALDLTTGSAAARAHPLPGDHRGLHRGEGRGDHQEHGSGGPGHPQPAGQRHAPADGLHRPLRRGPGRRHGDLQGPRQLQHPVQHLPQRRPHPDPDLLPVAGRPAGRPRPARRARGSTSCWSSRTAPRPSPTPTPSSWPTRRWARQRGLP